MLDTTNPSFALGMHWPTLDPFLFCAHHLDRYPAGNEELGIDAEFLAGRSIGSDFSELDGWSMYHGSTVPGFPQHPHRGFETVSFLRSGHVDHADSLGATARFGPGDVQWMTAGAGVQHAEMFPLLDRQTGNTVEMFQIWLNLPRTDKMAEPAFEMLWAETIPSVATPGGGRVLVLAGTFDGAMAPPPPPRSWAADPDHDVQIWHLDIPDGATIEVPAAAHGSNRVLYVYEGDSVIIDGERRIESGHGVQLTGAPTQLAGMGGARAMLLGGRPIGEPVAQYGPFVMNDTREVQQAYVDYQRTQFGGWPWPSPDPNHGPRAGRFAVLADGNRIEPPAPIAN